MDVVLHMICQPEKNNNLISFHVYMKLENSVLFIIFKLILPNNDINMLYTSQLLFSLSVCNGYSKISFHFKYYVLFHPK